MTMRILFNGSVLVKPGGASRVDASLFASAGLAGVGVVALIGEADGGEPNSVQIFTTPEKARKAFRSGPLAKAAALAFQPANDPRIPGGAAQLVCVKVNQSLQAAKTFQGTGTANAIVAAGVAGPYNLEPGQTVVVSVNAGPDQTATFTATAALKPGAGAVAATGAGNIVLTVNGGEVQTIPISGGLTTPEQVAQEINNTLRDATALVNGTAVDIRSDRRGTTAAVNITSVTATGTTVSTGSAAGTGNVSNIDEVSATEAGAVIVAAVTGISSSGDPLQLINNQVGSGSIQVKNTSTALAFGFDNLVHTAAAPVNVMVVTSLDYGVHTNKISFQVTDSGGGKILEVVFEDGTKKTTETSPVLGAAAELSVQYTGDASTAVMTISATQLTTTLAGDQTDGTVNLTVPFSTYTTLQEVINYINAQPGYVATAITTNPFTFVPSDLDYVTAVSIKPTAYSAFAKLFRCIEWVNQNSSLVSAERVSGGPTAPLQTTGKVLLLGGARGVSTNTNWQNAFDALGQVRVNEVVPLISQDLASLGQGSTATFASVAAQADAHVAFFSSTKGKNEREAYVGMKGTKSQFLAQAGVLNSIHTVLSSQQPTVLNEFATLELMPEWAFAVLQAGMRAGAELGEPLTWKYLRVNDMTQDASWNPQDDGEDLILGGCLIAEKVPNRGVRIVKGITTYTREDNDAYTEESIVMGWKNVAFELRTHLEDLFTGRKVSPQNISAVKSQADAKLSQLRAAGQIVDSVYADGSRDLAYRELEVSAANDTVTLSVVVSPVSGINFILNNIFLVPAQISA